MTRPSSTSRAPDGVLIDDDPLVHAQWKVAAAAHSKHLLQFTRLADFLALAPNLARSTPIYIDSNLGPGVRGETAAAQLRQDGFTTIYLCTGYEPGPYRGMSWLTGVRGKEPPWE